MAFIVKNTSKCGLLDLICPYHCRGCGEIGGILCDCCKKDINLDVLNHCPNCDRKIGFKCEDCDLPFDSVFALGYRDELIGKLAKEYKFHSARSLGKILAEIIDDFLPDLADNIVIVPLPTIQKHVRARGFDHTLKIAQHLAKIRGWKVEKFLKRKNNTVQVGANAKTRQKQAKSAYQFEGKIDSNKVYLLFDDFWTTGSSMKTAGKLMRKNGAKKLVAVVLATNHARKTNLKLE